MTLPRTSGSARPGRSSIAIHGGWPESCRFHVAKIADGVDVWIDGAGGPVVNIRLDDDDARALANAILDRQIESGTAGGSRESE